MAELGRIGYKLFQSIDDIDILNGIIHDEFFDVEKIKYNSSTNILDIPYSRCFHGENAIVHKKTFFKTVYEFPVLQCILRIHNILTYEIIDSEKMGRYDFNILEYNQDNKQITIVTCIPLHFFINVSNFKVEHSEIGFKGKCQIIESFLWQSGPVFIEE